MTLQGGTATGDTYAPGPGSGAGLSSLSFAGGNEAIYFLNLAPVLDLVAGPLVVNGTNADNAINYNVGPNSNTALVGGAGVNSGQVSVDGFEPVEFANKTALTINGLSGSDTINLNNPSKPTGLTGITVNGGDPTGSDTLVVNGTAAAGTVAVNISAKTITGVAGTGVTVSYGTIEHLTVVAGVSTTLSIAGSSSLVGVDYCAHSGLGGRPGRYHNDRRADLVHRIRRGNDLELRRRHA